MSADEAKGAGADGAGVARSDAVDGAGVARSDAVDGAGVARLDAVDGAGVARSDAVDGAGVARLDAVDGAGVARLDAVDRAGMASRAEALAGARGVARSDAVGGGGIRDRVEDSAQKSAQKSSQKFAQKSSQKSSEGFVPKFAEVISDSLPAFESTLARSVFTQGFGVHSGEAVSVSLHPADEGCGVLLRRVDLKNGHRDILVRYDRVEQRRLCTKVVNEVGSEVSMVEHLMCALYIAQIDNVLIELDASELPILDGSAYEWLALIDEAGIKRQKRARRYLQVHGSVESREGDRFCRISANAHASLSVDFTIDFPNKSVGQQRLHLSGERHSDWRGNIAPARTFAFKEDIEKLRQQNFALGGSLDNALVVDDNGVVNPEGLRFKDELVRHKILDLCGDLYLAGLPILGSITANKSGHRLNNRLLQTLFASKSIWREVRLKASSIPNPIFDGLSAGDRHTSRDARIDSIDSIDSMR